MASLIRRYRWLLHNRPFVTNVLTSCTFMTAGDLISQLLLQRPNKSEEVSQGASFIDQINLKQTAKFALAGLIFVGPTVRGCLVLIDKLFGPTTSVRVLAKKLLVDQGLIAPCFLAGNISVLTMIGTRSIDSVKSELERSYLGLLKANYCFWPFVQVINFYFIPLAYRVPFGSSAALAWITILSYKISNKQTASPDELTS